MAEIWKDGDSARLMTKKYNDTAKEVESLKSSFNKNVTPIPGEIEKLQKQIDKKIESVTAEDIGLGEVDNTPDIKKPVSEPQDRAIKRAEEDMLTSEPASDLEDAEETSFITSINVSGSKLVISF